MRSRFDRRLITTTVAIPSGILLVGLIIASSQDKWPQETSKCTGIRWGRGNGAFYHGMGDLTGGRQLGAASGLFHGYDLTNNDLDPFTKYAQQGKGENRLYSLIVEIRVMSRLACDGGRDMGWPGLRTVLDTYFRVPNLLEEAGFSSWPINSIRRWIGNKRRRSRFAKWGSGGPLAEARGGVADSLPYRFN